MENITITITKEELETIIYSVDRMEMNEEMHILCNKLKTLYNEEFKGKIK